MKEGKKRERRGGAPAFRWYGPLMVNPALVVISQLSLSGGGGVLKPHFIVGFTKLLIHLWRAVESTGDTVLYL